MDNERGMSEVCFSCWYGGNECQLDEELDKLTSDTSQKAEEISEKIADIKKELTQQGCPNVDTILPLDDD